jgi:tRNA(fMet)-specific endonuclease VapC
MKMSRLAAPILLAACIAAPACALPADTSGAPKMLLHGNYCGPSNNAPLAPIDALDQACARHDACTPDGVLPSKACNLRLQADAERVAQDLRQPSDLRALAGLVASGAAMMPFDPSPRSVVPVGMPSVESAPIVGQPSLKEDIVTDDGGRDEE